MISIIAYESSVKVGKTKELLNIALRVWGWPFCNAFNLDGVHLDCSVGDDESKILDSGGFEGTLGGFKEQFVTAKDLENLSDDLPVMF